MILDVQVYPESQGHTLSRFHTECRRGIQAIKRSVVVSTVAVKLAALEGLDILLDHVKISFQSYSFVL